MLLTLCCFLFDEMSSHHENCPLLTTSFRCFVGLSSPLLSNCTLRGTSADGKSQETSKGTYSFTTKKTKLDVVIILSMTTELALTASTKQVSSE